MDTSVKVIGAVSSKNIAKIVFTPTTLLPADGGMVEVISPPVFSSLKNPIYPHDNKEFDCASKNLAGISTVADPKKPAIEIKYEYLTGKDTKAKVTIECAFWQNPVAPMIMKNFRMKTYDKFKNCID